MATATTLPATRSERINQQKADMVAISQFIPLQQMAYLVECVRSRDYDGDHAPNLAQLRKTIEGMPVTYAQDGMGDAAIASLHYFTGSCDWYITEKDAGSQDDNPEDFQTQAFGLASLGFEPELGYISIRELCSARGVEIDFHFTPRTLGQVKAELDAKSGES